MAKTLKSPEVNERIRYLREEILKEKQGVYAADLGITQGAFSYSTAVGMFKSVVATVMVLTTNWICKKCGETGLY